MAPNTDRVDLGYAAAALGLMFATLAVAVAAGASLPGDRWLLAEVHSAIGASIDDPALLVARLTDAGPLALVAAVVVAVLVGARRLADAAWFFVAVAFVLLVNPVLKDIFARDRPDVRQIPEPVSMYGFPSGHGANTAASVGAIVMVLWSGRRRALASGLGVAFLVVVAFSQLAIGAHYPSDILAGWSWTGAWIAVVALARSRRR